MMITYIIAHHWLQDSERHVTLMPGAFDNRRDAQDYANRLMRYEEEYRAGAALRHLYEVCTHQCDDTFPSPAREG